MKSDNEIGEGLERMRRTLPVGYYSVRPIAVSKDYKGELEGLLGEEG